MLTKEQKREQSEQLRSALGDAAALFVLQNHGLNVNEVNQLRSKVRQTSASYKVVKNSVVRLAVEGTELETLDSHLTGPNALAFTDGDGVALAKVLREFAKDHPELTFKRGYLEGQFLDAEEATAVADLPSRDELVSRLLYLLQSPIRRLAVALNGPIQKFTTAVSQIAEKESQAS